MDSLNDLYHKRQVFIEFNTPVPDELNEQIHAIEIEIFSSFREIILSYLKKEIEMPAESSIIVGLEYRNGKLIKYASSFNSTIEDKFEYISDVCEEEADYEDDDDDDERENQSHRDRSKSIGFTIKFDNGKIIKYPTAQRTMIEALRYMGLERASQFRDEMFKGFPLIGKEQRTTDGKRWQLMVDGWWVYIRMSNERKITCLKSVARMLNIAIEIIPDDEKGPVSPEQPNRHRSLYSLNGSLPMAKNRSVWATVKFYLESKEPSFDEIQKAFPASLQGSYGVVRTIADINKRSKRNLTEKKRWFLDANDILTSVDGIEFAVSTEWGHNFDVFKGHVNKIQNITLKETKVSTR